MIFLRERRIISAMNKNATNDAELTSEDLSKVDIGNDFRNFPQLYKTPEDIENFIRERNVDVPVLSNLLKLRRENELDMTPTEREFYFASMFGYIYDVYRVPVEKTYGNVIEWLEYIEDCLVFSGFSYFIAEAYQYAYHKYERIEFVSKILNRDSTKERINYYSELVVKYLEFYISKRPELIESFWIKSSRSSGQPVAVGDEAYMRVHVYPDRVYIMGCDDSSFTFRSKTEQESRGFAEYLKCGAPVWNFHYFKTIHPNLEFTN